MKNLGTAHKVCNFGFTLAEMMVVLLIMTIILAAMAPVMTTRMSASKTSGGGSFSGAEIWKYVEDSGETDIYYGTTNNQRVMIGQNKAQTAENARLIINTSNNIPNHLLFRKGESNLGVITIGSDKSILIGNLAQNKTTASSSITIGDGSAATMSNTIAIGSGAITTSENTIAIGSAEAGYTTLGAGAVAIGNSARATYKGTVALGYNAQATSGNSTAVGEESIAEGTGATAFGQGVVAKFGGVALGQGAQATAGSTVALGVEANATGSQTLALGTKATSSGLQSVALGHGATVSGDYSIALGTAAVSSKKHSVAIGYGTVVASDYEIRLGGGDNTVNIPGALQVKGAAVTSDKRLKNVGKEYIFGLDKIRLIQPYNFTFKDDEKKVPQVGVMAQDLQKIFPNAVHKGVEGYLTIRMEDMFYAVINAIKELDAKIAALTDTIKQVQQDNYQLKKENKELKKRVEALEAR